MAVMGTGAQKYVVQFVNYLLCDINTVFTHMQGELYV
jgi:hypothetical protein